MDTMCWNIRIAHDTIYKYMQHVYVRYIVNYCISTKQDLFELKEVPYKNTFWGEIHHVTSQANSSQVCVCACILYIYIPTRHLYIIQYKYIVNKICIHISNVCTHTYYQKKYGQKYPWYSFSRMQPPRSNLKITEAGTSTKDPGFMRFLADLFRVDKEWFPGRFPIPKFLKPKKTKDVVVELQKFQRLGSPKKKNWLRPLALPTQNLTLQDLGEHPTLPGVISSWFRPLAPVHGTNAQASDMLVEGLCQTWRRDCHFISCDDCDSLHNIGTYQNYVDTGKRPQTFA